MLLTVGPGKAFATFAAANAAAANGDTIQIDAGTYTNDYAGITKNITITGVGGMPHFLSTGNIPGDKAIWVINANVAVNNIEMSGAVGPSGNDEAIRQESGDLALNSVWIHDCQTGLLTNNGGISHLTIDTCEFNNCGAGDGSTHNIYVGIIASVSITNSFFHDASVGHNIKSRALSTTITSTRIFDNSATTSYSIDIPQGGVAVIQNNVIQQGSNSQNPNIIAFAAEGSLNPSPSLQVSGNAIVNDLVGSPVGVINFSGITASITNNQIYGLTSGQIASGPNSQSGNTTLDARPTLDQSHPWLVVVPAVPRPRLIIGAPAKRPKLPAAAAAGISVVAGVGARIAAAVASAAAAGSAAGAGAGSMPGLSLTTLTLVNTSGSTQAANFVTPMFGHPFKKGDIGSTDYPKFELTDGTNIPYTTWNKATWSDGSWKFAGFMLRVPSSIAGSGSLTVNVKSGGAAPAASSRTTAEVASALINMVAVGKANLSGTWNSSLATAIADAKEVVLIGDGPAGKVWRILGDYKQSGSPHGQLVCYHYIQALQNSAAGLYGYRYLPRTTQPYYNLDTPIKNQRVLSSLTIQHGAGPTTINPFPYTPKTMSWDAGLPPNMIRCTGHGFPAIALAGGVICVPVQFTTTGSLPPGLALNTTYYALPAGSTDPNTLRVMTDSTEFGDPIITGAGSGVHTMTPYGIVKHFGSQWGATSQARWNYIQGAGSIAADATVRVQFNKNYWRSTRVLPPFDTTLSVASSTAVTWDPLQINPINFYLEETGERETLGVMSGYHTRHFLTQAAVDETVVRCIGFAQSHMGTCIRDVSTLGVVNIGSPSALYPGLPASLAGTFQFSMGNNPAVSGFTPPANSQNVYGTDMLLGFDGNSFDHQHDFAYYPYLITGEPNYLDLVVEMGLSAVYTQDPNGSIYRNPTTPVTLYGIATGQPLQMRGLAWSLRDLVKAAGIHPDISPDGKSTGVYLKDLANNSLLFLNAYLNSLNFYCTTNGLHAWAATSYAPWQMSYVTWTVCLAAALLESNDAMTWLQNARSKWLQHRLATDGSLWTSLSYYHIVAHDYPALTTLVSSEAQWASFLGYAPLISWNSGTQLFSFTFNPVSGLSAPTWTSTNDDRYIFTTVVPGGFSRNTPYYAVNVSGASFKLSSTIGGAAITITDTGSIDPAVEVGIAPKSPPTIGSTWESGSGLGVFNQRGSCRYMVALGITGLAAAQAYYDATYTGNPADDPRYATVASF